LRLDQSEVGCDKEVSKTPSHAVLEKVVLQALYHLLVLKAFEGILEKGRELGRRRYLLASGGTLLPTFMNNKVARGGSAWGVIPEGWSEPTRRRVRGRHDFAHPLPLEDEGRASALVLRIDGHHPFLPVVNRGWFSCIGAEVAEGGEVAGDEVPTPATNALRLASTSASFFFLSLLRPMSAQRQRITTKGQDM